MSAGPPAGMGVHLLEQQPQNPWHLVEDGRLEEAVREYSRRYEQGHEVANLLGRASARLLLGDYAGALRDTQISLAEGDPRLRADTQHTRQGICYWYLRQPLLAVQSWRNGLTAPYTDAAGGVQVPALLLYAAERLADAALRKEALTLLRKHGRRKSRPPRQGGFADLDIGAWPGPIVHLLLGNIDASALDGQAARARHPHLLARWQCQADFYVALRALRDGDLTTFRARMAHAAASSYGYLEDEYYLGRWEVENGFPMPAFPGEVSQ